MVDHDPKANFEISQEFYGERYFVGYKESHETGYSDYEDGDWARKLTEIILRYFKPQRALDVGCARGYIVHRLMQAGVFAAGVDYSEYAVATSPREARPFVMQGDALSLPFANEAFDLVVCIETLEHLWPSQGRQAIEELSRVTSNWVFLSIPSFGFNDFGPCAIPIISPSHVEDAKAHRSFRELSIDPDGLPHHGHLTNATYHWWTDLLAEQGLHRTGWLERQINRDPLCDPKCWMIYAARKAPPQGFRTFELVPISDSYIEMGYNDDTHLGTGWYDYDEQLGARWTTEEAIAYCQSTAEDTYVLLEYKFPLSLEVQLGATAEIYRRRLQDPEDGSEACTVENLTLTPTKKWTQRCVRLPDVGDDDSVVELRFRVSNPWEDESSPSRYTERRTGICVRRIQLSPYPASRWPLRCTARFLLRRWRRYWGEKAIDYWHRAKGAPSYYSRHLIRRVRGLFQQH